MFPNVSYFLHFSCTQPATIAAATQLNMFRDMLALELTHVAWLEQKMIDDCCVPLQEGYIPRNQPALLQEC